MAVNLTTLSRDTPIPMPQQLRVNTEMVTICNNVERYINLRRVGSDGSRRITRRRKIIGRGDHSRLLAGTSREPDLVFRHLLQGLASALEAGNYRLTGGLHLQQPGVVTGRTETVIWPGYRQALDVLTHLLLSLINLLQLISDRAECVNGCEGETELSGWLIFLRPGVLVDAVSQSVHPHLSLSGAAGSHLLQHKK